MLHLLFNIAQNYQININVLDEIPYTWSSTWIPFSEEEFITSIAKYNNSSTPVLNKLLWRYLKCIIKDKRCLKSIIDIANICFKLGHWPSHFKTSMTIIILKPNKELYDSPKSFRPIVLLNTLGKLIEEVISKHLQFQSISKNFIYPSQLGRLKQRSTADAGIALTYFICMGWVRNIATSTLAFDIAQFFPSLNHCLLPHILSKAGFDPKVKHFFSNYLVRRKTQYF